MSGEIDSIAKALPDYDVTRELGRGAMGVVYGGTHKKLGRNVAIKELPASFASSDEVRQRFVDEAKTLASLSHPHIVPIFDYVERDGECLLVMEALPNGTVWERFVNQGMTASEACATVMAACAGLEHAHGRGVLHRDVKPENLMFSTDDELKVTDFGISKVINGSQTMATSDGGVLGTPAYMAPEQGEGKTVDARADVYAAGTMLYELMSGKLPFEGGADPLSILVQRSNEEPPSLADAAPHVPSALVDVTMISIARSPDDRYASAEEFGVAIAEAAAVTWGPSWIDTTGIRVQGSDAMAVAARTTISQAPTSTDTLSPQVAANPAAAAPTIAPHEEPFVDKPRTKATYVPGAPVTDDDEVAGADQDVADPPADIADAVEAAPVGAPPMPDAEPVSIRPQVTSHDHGVDLANVDAASLVNVREVVRPPSVPWYLMAIGAVVAAIGVIIALVGLGDPDVTVGQRPPSNINGQFIVDNEVEIDLSEDVVTVGGLPDGTATAELAFSVVGIPLGATDVIDVTGPVIELEPGITQWLPAGGVVGTLTLTSDDGATAEHEFLANASQPFYLTALGVGSGLVALFALSTIESNFRPLRRGRRSMKAVIGAAISGAVLGVGLGFFAGAALGTQVTIPHLVVAAILTGVGVGLIAWVVRKRGRQRRIVRAAEARGMTVSR